MLPANVINLMSHDWGSNAPAVLHYVHKDGTVKSPASGKYRNLRSGAEVLDFKTGEIFGGYCENRGITNQLLIGNGNTAFGWTLFDGDTWLAAPGVPDPAGGALTGQFIENTNSSTHRIVATVQGVVAASTAMAVSGFVKPNGRDEIAITVFDKDGLLHLHFFTLQDNNMTFASLPGTSNINIHRLAGGWWWVGFTIDNIGTGASPVLIELTGLVDLQSIYEGDGVSGLYMYGFQVEHSITSGEEFVAHPIITTGETLLKTEEKPTFFVAGLNTGARTIYLHASLISRVVYFDLLTAGAVPELAIAMQPGDGLLTAATETVNKQHTEALVSSDLNSMCFTHDLAGNTRIGNVFSIVETTDGMAGLPVDADTVGIGRRFSTAGIAVVGFKRLDIYPNHFATKSEMIDLITNNGERTIPHSSGPASFGAPLDRGAGFHTEPQEVSMHAVNQHITELLNEDTGRTLT